MKSEFEQALSLRFPPLTIIDEGLEDINADDVMCRSVEEYISAVLSQIDCLDSKKIIRRKLRSDINEIIRGQHRQNQSKEQLVNILFVKMGDPKKLGQYYFWLKNLVDLH